MLKKCNKIWRCNWKLLIVVFLDIIINLLLYYIVEESIAHIQLKRFITSMLVIFSVLIAMIFSLKFERDISCVDPLTGAYNRRKLYLDLNKNIKNKKKFELIYIDLNNFKEINDLHGHKAGDEILTEFGKKASKLGSDIACYRIGGDEFIFIANSSKYSLEKLSGFNFSHGVASFPEDSTGMKNTNDIIDRLLTIADKNMYKRKYEMKQS